MTAATGPKRVSFAEPCLVAKTMTSDPGHVPLHGPHQLRTLDNAGDFHLFRQAKPFLKQVKTDKLRKGAGALALAVTENPGQKSGRSAPGNGIMSALAQPANFKESAPVAEELAGLETKP